ncbi:MAG: zinc-binding protein [Syntrophus sp. (in: bacteria)]|nr:zinc-binding protein [Syntrophus sp. (in: bacteria)]
MAAVLAVCIVMVFLTSCQAKQEKAATGKRLIVVTSLFPIYDFARNIGQARADVSLLLPPGVEAHSFEPRPGDMVRLHQASVFIYTNNAMEPWVQGVLKGLQNRSLKVVESGRGVAMTAGHDAHTQEKKTAQKAHTHGNKADHGHKSDHQHGHDNDGADPHIWLDFSNAVNMVDHIVAGFIEKDPANQAFYQQNADAYKVKLNDLDRQFKEGLSGCRKNVIVHGGHFAFGYLADRYGLKYVAVSGFSPNAEPTPAGMVKISKTLKANGLNHLFYEELLSPRVAESIARETGTSLLMLHAAHNVSKEEFERGVSFMDLMQRNLQNLKRGLQCPQS